MHQDLAKYLSCYSKSTQGGQYQRRCESRRHGKAQANTIMNQHGLVWNQIQTYECDADGSFAKVTNHFSRLTDPDTAESLKIRGEGGLWMEQVFAFKELDSFYNAIRDGMDFY